MGNSNEAQSLVQELVRSGHGSVFMIMIMTVFVTLISQRARPKPSFVIIDSKYCAVNVRWIWFFDFNVWKNALISF